jgi:hypothetical protein
MVPSRRVKVSSPHRNVPSSWIMDKRVTGMTEYARAISESDTVCSQTNAGIQS